MSPERGDLDEAIERLLKDALDAQAAARALRRVSHEGHDHSFAQEIGQLMSALQLDVSMARAEWALHRARTASDLGSAIEEVARIAEIWFNDPDVQRSVADSGRRGATVTLWIEGISEESRRTANRVAEAAEDDLAEMRKFALRTIHRVRVALGDAVASLRHHS